MSHFVIRRASAAGLVVFALLISNLPAAKGGVIVSQPSSTISGASRWFGQSFTTPSDAQADFIDQVSFRTTLAQPPSGKMYLLTQPFAGMASQLSTSTPGYLGRSDTLTIQSGTQTFALFDFVGGARPQLAPGMQYWVYSDSAVSWTSFWSNSNPYAGGEMYIADEAATSYVSTGGFSDAQFSVSATPVPEPASAMALVALTTVAAAIRRRRA